jgi:hypothetical protein
VGSETIVLFSSRFSAEAAGKSLTDPGYADVPGYQELLSGTGLLAAAAAARDDAHHHRAEKPRFQEEQFERFLARPPPALEEEDAVGGVEEDESDEAAEGKDREPEPDDGVVAHFEAKDDVAYYDSKDSKDNTAGSDFDDGDGVQRGVVRCRLPHQTSEPPYDPADDVGGCNGQYWPNLIHLVNCMDGVLEDESGLEMKQEAMEALAAQNGSQQQVCSLLLELGECLLSEQRAVSDPAAMDMWLDTMRLFASGQLSQHCDRFADTSVNELLACLDSNCGSLRYAYCETE